MSQRQKHQIVVTPSLHPDSTILPVRPTDVRRSPSAIVPNIHNIPLSQRTIHKALAPSPSTMPLSPGPKHFPRTKDPPSRVKHTMPRYLFNPPRIPARLHTLRGTLSSISQEVRLSFRSKEKEAEDTSSVLSTIRLVPLTPSVDSTSMSSWRRLPSLEAATPGGQRLRRDVMQPMLYSLLMVSLMLTIFIVGVTQGWIGPYKGDTSRKGKGGR